MYKPDHFLPHELVDQQTYALFEGQPDTIYRLFPEGLLRAADDLRELFGSITINNWFYGCERQWSGFRHERSRYYSRNSQHSSCNALDMVFSHAEVPAVHAYIMANEAKFYALGIRRLESLEATAKHDGISAGNWCRMDTKECGKPEGKIHVFRP